MNGSENLELTKFNGICRSRRIKEVAKILVKNKKTPDTLKYREFITQHGASYTSATSTFLKYT